MKALVMIVATAGVLASSTLSAAADTWVFKDVLRPGGHSRSMKAKFSDAHACGAVGNSIPDDIKWDLQSCMLAHGWVRDHVIDDPAPRHTRTHHNVRSPDDDEELRKRNEDASNDAEARRDEESRNDDAQRQLQDQINNDAMINNLNNQ